MRQLLGHERQPDGSINWRPTCPACGWKPEVDNNPAPMLPAETFLAGKYFVGGHAGRYKFTKWWGSFGYIGYDIPRRKTVLIREFWSSHACRDRNGYDVKDIHDPVWFTGGKNRFYLHCRTLLGQPPRNGFLNVQDTFEENGTAYAVYEYEEGTLLSDRPKAMSMAGTLEAFRSAADSLQGLHKAGLFHLSIAPRTALITSLGYVKLLDEGYAFLPDTDNTAFIPTMPEKAIECFTKEISEDARTDEYALAATIYFALTRQHLTNAMDRLNGEELVRPSALGARISPAQEEVLLKGLALMPYDRYPSVKEFYDTLLG